MDNFTISCLVSFSLQRIGAVLKTILNFEQKLDFDVIHCPERENSLIFQVLNHQILKMFMYRPNIQMLLPIGEQEGRVFVLI
jgi:hypothetical protein